MKYTGEELLNNCIDYGVTVGPDEAREIQQYYEEHNYQADYEELGRQLETLQDEHYALTLFAELVLCETGVNAKAQARMLALAEQCGILEIIQK